MKIKEVDLSEDLSKKYEILKKYYALFEKDYENVLTKDIYDLIESEYNSRKPM